MRSLAVALFACAACASTPPAPAPARSPAAPPAHHALHLFFTSDEHGWLAPLKDKKAGLSRGGVVALYDSLVHDESYDPNNAADALFSDGDMWTGPFESTALEGAPMVAAMNRMGYRAAAVGNHELDFGTKTLVERGRTARFPFLACNIVQTATGELVGWAKPFTLVDVGGVKLGVVGLASVDSPVTSDPRNMTGLSFLPYAPALEKWIPKARAAGAEQIVVLLHDGIDAARALLPTLQKHRVRAVGLGHHHVQSQAVLDGGTADLDDDVTVCNPGAFVRGYCRVDLELDGDKLVSHGVAVKRVTRPLDDKPAGDPALVSIVQGAEKRAEEVGGEVLVQNAHDLVRGVDGPLGQLVVDAWLAALPWAQVAILNAGGLRQDLAAGPVRMRDVASVLPFNDTLLVVDVTGAELKEVLAMPGSIAGGVRFTFKDGAGARVIESVVDRDGKPIADDAKLKVVVNDFMYRGGDHYRFHEWDAEPEETAIEWREPVLRRLRDLAKRQQTLDVTADDRARRLPL